MWVRKMLAFERKFFSFLLVLSIGFSYLGLTSGSALAQADDEGFKTKAKFAIVIDADKPITFLKALIISLSQSGTTGQTQVRKTNRKHQ